MKPVILKWATSLLMAIGAAIAKIPPSFDVLLCFFLLDYATGMYAAMYRRELSSDIAWRGIGKKLVTLIIVCSCSLIEDPLRDALGLTIHTGKVAVLMYTFYELISILENATRCDVPVPPPIMKILSIVPRPRLVSQEDFDRLKRRDREEGIETKPNPNDQAL